MVDPDIVAVPLDGPDTILYISGSPSVSDAETSKLVAVLENTL